MKLFILFIATVLTVTSCGEKQREIAKTNTYAGTNTKRYASITGLKPEKVDHYKALHAEVWPKVLATITACNIRNYSIYLKEIDDRFYLFSYFEYIGDDFDRDMEKMAADTVTQRWWKETDPCQIPLPEATAANQVWTPMEEVFHTP